MWQEYDLGEIDPRRVTGNTHSYNEPDFNFRCWKKHQIEICLSGH